MTWGRGPTLLVAAAVTLAVAVTAGYALTRRSAPASAATATAAVTRGTVTVDASAAGTVNVVTTRGLSFSMSEQVTEVDVKVGDQVTAGQTLAKIDATTAQQGVSAAQQQVTAAQDNLTKAQQPPPSTVCTVAFESPSPSPSPSRPKPSASARPSASPSARPSRTPSRCATGGTGGGTGSARDALGAAQVQFNNAQLALLQAQQRLAGTVLVAPVAGKVLSVAGTVGSQERPGGTGFIVLGNVNDTAVQAMFSETDVAHLAVGQPASITLPNRPDPVTGKVSQISPAGTTSGRLVRYGVLIAFDQVPPDLLFGQSASVRVTTAQASGVLRVPTSAVTGGGTVTVRVGKRDEKRTVQLGLRGDQYTEIKSGLNEGEQVVL
jgi:multidrug efflux pump subunit AcrA (membrane-fusion protein)